MKIKILILYHFHLNRTEFFRKIQNMYSKNKLIQDELKLFFENIVKHY